MWLPSTYSSTRKGCPVSDTPASISSAMWGCFCQARPARQFQSARLQKTFLRQQAVLAKQYFKLIGQGWVLVLERGQPDRALVVCHLQRFVKVWTKNLPLIGAELGHL